MPICSSLRRAGLLVGLLVALAPTDGRAQDEGAISPAMRRELRFIQGLRERGYYDLALDYIARLRDADDTPADLRAVLDYQEGRGLLDEATRMADLEKRAAQLDAARVKLEAFAKAHPEHPLAPEALVQTARLLYERGQTAVLQGNETRTDDEKNAKLAEARAAFAAARKAYDQAVGILQKAYDAYPRFLPENDPRKARRDAAHVALMDASLQRALVDYEEAQTFPPKSAERTKLLDTGLTSFEDIYKRYRTQLAGLYARMWEAKCYEEKGELGPAMGIYKELMDHPAPELRDLKRKVEYFQVIVDGKRGEHPLAVDRANQWLKDFPNAVETDDGLGVRLELAKNLLAQLDGMNENQKKTTIDAATEVLQKVVKVYSPYKPEAVALLQKYRPRAAINASAIAGLSYENAYADAEGAIASHEWDRAVALLKHAVRRADPTRKPEEANRARHLMAFAFYSDGRYYESAVLGEFLARNYPKWGLAPKSAEIALAALTAAYGDNKAIDRGADLQHLVGLSTYVAEAWPTSDQADYARTLLGEIAMGQGRYADAAEAFESIRPESSRYLDARVRSGDAHWREGRRLSDQGKNAEADAQAAKSLELLNAALKARRDQGVPPTDPGFITNANALAEVLRAGGKAKEALDLLGPIAQQLGNATLSAETAPLYEAMLTVMLKSHIAAGQSDRAIADMQALEKAGSSKEKLTQLYYELSKSLQQEMEVQRQRKDPNLPRTQAAYRQFLNALAKSKGGQSYDSLMFAGESMLGLAADESPESRATAKEAAAVLENLLKTYQKDPQFLSSPGSEDRLLRARLKLAEALRRQKQFAEAQKLVSELLKDNPKLLEFQIEQGLLLEDWARAEPKRWGQAYNYWRTLASRLERARTRRLDYYDAIYHVAVALRGLNRKPEAVQTLKSIMILSPTVGSPEMKKRYEGLLNQLGR